MGLQDLLNRNPSIIPKNTPYGAAGERNTPGQGINTYKLNKAKMDALNASKKIAAREGQRDLLLKQKTDAEKRIKAAEDQLDVFDKVQILLQKTSEFARQQVKGHLEEIVSHALNVVYGGNHVFSIDLVVRANRPEVDYYLNDGTTLTKMVKPDFDRGGGKINVITIALRLGIDELEGDKGPLLLDEIGANVDGEAAVNLAYFLKEYSIKCDRQIVLITHNEALADVADFNIRVSKANGTAKVKNYKEGGTL
jgi:DNA repair exonuclease SbcCD ATPase subunit